MDTTQYDKLLNYTLKMNDRGDGFSDILLYLDRQGADVETKKSIIQKLEEHRKRSSASSTRRPYPVSAAKIVVGMLFFGLTLYLQYLGVIVFPWTLLGVLAAVGALIEIVKVIINITRK
jgi:hypothetical protein